VKPQLLLVSILLIASALAFLTGRCEVAYSLVVPGLFSEYIWIDLYCVNGTLDVECRVASSYPPMVHFPSEVDMFDPGLEKCLGIVASFNRTKSKITYAFNQTSTEDARTYADALMPSMNSAFGLTFDWGDTRMEYPYVIVSYTAPGITGMTSFTENLKSKCLKSDIEGFSNVFLNMIMYTPQSTVSLEAHGPIFLEDPRWTYHFSVKYTTSMPSGENSHTIDVLDLLGISELEPSLYSYSSYYEAYDNSYLYCDIYSPWNATYISCEPCEGDYGTKGWRISTYETDLWTTFDFHDDPTPVDSLSLTFSGKVVPEFGFLTMMLVFLGATALTPVLRGFFSKES
jgi:hypothetical protein